MLPLSILGFTASSVLLLLELSMSWVMTTHIKCSVPIPLRVHLVHLLSVFMQEMEFSGTISLTTSISNLPSGPLQNLGLRFANGLAASDANKRHQLSFLIK